MHSSEQCSQNGEIRLTNGVNSHEGRVEICLDGLWSTVCDEFWDESDARVACRQLGFLTLGLPLELINLTNDYYGGFLCSQVLKHYLVHTLVMDLALCGQMM